MRVPNYERVPLGAGQDSIEMSVRSAKPTAESDESAVVPLFTQRRTCVKGLIGWFCLVLIVLAVFACVGIFELTWVNSVNAENKSKEVAPATGNLSEQAVPFSLFAAGTLFSPLGPDPFSLFAARALFSPSCNLKI